MLTHQTVVIEFEGFRFVNQLFSVEELSVRGFSYNETILLKPLFPNHLVSVNARKSYTRTPNIILGLNWDSGNYDYFFLYCFFLSLKIRFPNINVYARGNKKCFFDGYFFPGPLTWITLTVPKRPTPAELHFQLS